MLKPTRPKKFWGQNFLVDENMQRKIIAACRFDEHETVLEIGPGRGALTRWLAGRVKTLYAVEKDRSLAVELQEQFVQPASQIINQDFLLFDIRSLPLPVKVIGNLPYNISTPIIGKLIENRDALTDVFCTVQLEFAQRLLAKADTKAYGSLSCFFQYYAEGKKLFNIPKTCFLPVPKVTSCLMHFRFRKHSFSATDPDHLFRVIRMAFQQRRKTLLNALSVLSGKEQLLKILRDLQLSSRVRAENVSLVDFVRISQALIDKRF